MLLNQQNINVQYNDINISRENVWIWHTFNYKKVLIIETYPNSLSKQAIKNTEWLLLLTTGKRCECKYSREDIKVTAINNNLIHKKTHKRYRYPLSENILVWVNLYSVALSLGGYDELMNILSVNWPIDLLI